MSCPRVPCIIGMAQLKILLAKRLTQKWESIMIFAINLSKWDNLAYIDQSATLTTTHTDTGLRIERNGRSETFFLLLYGLPAVVARVQVDGTEFPLLTGNQLTSLPPGWYQDGALRTVIRLPYAVKQTVEITFAAGQ